MTGYMKEMRKLVGHRTIIQCAASIICVDEESPPIRNVVETFIRKYM